MAARLTASVARSMPRAHFLLSSRAVAQISMPELPKVPLKAAAAIASGLALVGFAKQSYLMTDAGIIYVHQNTLTGTLSVYSEPGLYWRLPFFSSVTEYKQVITESFGTSDTEKRAPMTVRFADTYTGVVPCTFRFKLSLDPMMIVRMHKEFRNQINLENTLLDRNAQNVTIITATQYTGEEFFQGGLNIFKSQLADQLRQGVYETVRKQVEVEQMDLAPVGLDQRDPKKIQKSVQLVWKTIPLLDEVTNLPKRSENPLEQYGIEVTQVTIGDPKPEQQLEHLLSEKKRLVAERIKAVQEQETAKAQANTEQLRKEIQRTREVQDAQREKELAVIGQMKEVEIAKQIAERQIVEERKKQEIAQIEREKQLEIARANFQINEANAAAAKAEAEAIMQKGSAEAAVLDKKYAALGKNKQIYLAEMQRDVAQVLYSNLKEFKVTMPANYIQGDGAGKLTTNLDVITGFAALASVDQLAGLNSASKPGWFSSKPTVPKS